VAAALGVVALFAFSGLDDRRAAGDETWLVVDVSVALALAGWGALRALARRRDGVAYLLQFSALAWGLAALAEAGALRTPVWEPFGAATDDVRVIAHLLARSLLIAAAVVVLPDRSEDGFLQRGPVDAAVAGVTVCGLVLAFSGAAGRDLSLTPFGFGNRAWIEVVRDVPFLLLVGLLAAHVLAALSLAWTRRGLPPTSFQVIGWVLAVAAVPVVVGQVGKPFGTVALDVLTLLVFPALPVLSVLSTVRAVVAGARTVRHLRLTQRRMVEAVEDERRRLRNELHDGLGPTLAGVALGVRAASKQVSGVRPDTAALLTRMGDEIDGALDEVRRIVYALRPPVLDQLGLVAAIEVHARRLCADEDAPELTLAVGGLHDAKLNAAVELAAFRIVAEAVTNVVRHAGARHCTVTAAVDTNAVMLSVTDDGRGLPIDMLSGVGLTSMRERAAAVGGDVSVGTGPLGGTLVRARLPLATS
jgi:signal transduction histidine kinase